MCLGLGESGIGRMRYVNPPDVCLGCRVVVELDRCLQLAKLQHERAKIHHQFQTFASGYRWSKFDLAIAEQDLAGMRHKVEAAAMTYINPESYGSLSPLIPKRKVLE